EGILSVDPEAIIKVCDGHGGMNNINPIELHKSATLVRGSPKPLSQVSGIDSSFDAAMFVGYHSMKGTLNGTLSHTYNGTSIASLHINGIEVGETAMNAGIAGFYGVPLVLVTGDVAVTREAKAINSEIVTVAVKEAVSRHAAECIHPEKATEMIRKGAAEAVKKRKSIEPHVVPKPVDFTIRFTDASRADAAMFIPTAERIDGMTVRFIQKDYITAFNAFIAAVMCSSTVS
ncbi:MAG: M55 family metallopeptidase, partial [Candidatus Bathyarchaeota archaeon]|nr:M55 family metallopeptidase [Candidatus Bathyarchaeota archaeon]